ncbi:HTH_Tnp_Tc3_2 domain-containing protein [Trichonephila clavipes]|nr:HTH_Tnp_Tc3_2 domain-containing protein [Trichonephila clavipes]
MFQQIRLFIEKKGEKTKIYRLVYEISISLWKEEKSVPCTGKILKLSKSIVFNIIDRFKRTNSVGKKQRSGRPKIFNEREERWIAKQVGINPRTSAVKMTLKFKNRFGKSVNPETVRNVLRKHKYQGRVPQRKPYISKANRQGRLAFAKMKIGSRVGRNQTTVMRICDRWIQEGTTNQRGRSHPPQCTTSREDRQTVRMAVKDHSVTSRTVAQHIESITHHLVSARTIRRRLQQSGLSARCPFLFLPLTQKHRRLHRQWCD